MTFILTEKKRNGDGANVCFTETVKSMSESMGGISDGHHTFDELYQHRCALFVALMRSNPGMSWRANNHDDGTMFENWFIAGMHLPTGDISYHLPVTMWTMLDGKQIATSNKAPKWDGHTAADVVERLEAWAKSN